MYTQTEQLDRIIRQNRSATGAELLSLTNFNTSERTIRRYHLSLGYRPRKSVIKVKSKMPKTQNELENAVDQALYSLPLIAVQSCIKKTQKTYQQLIPSY